MADQTARPCPECGMETPSHATALGVKDGKTVFTEIFHCSNRYICGHSWDEFTFFTPKTPEVEEPQEKCPLCDQLLYNGTELFGDIVHLECRRRERARLGMRPEL